MPTTRSVHALVRSLKSSTDPPASPGPSKIGIACDAWSDESFHANKGEVIGEWILTQLAQAAKTRREKDANPIVDPVADSRYWTLLRSVLTAPPPPAVRPVKTWLLPLLNRLQLDAIVVRLLTLRSPQVLGSARVALSVLWPLAERKIGLDALGECLGVVFDACMEWERVDDDLCWICSVVVRAYTNALANAGNKRKLYHSFITTNIFPWLCAVRASPSLVTLSSTKQLQDSIYTAGTDIIFSLDALRQPLDALFDALYSSMSLNPSFHAVLPQLFASFITATHKHRPALLFCATGTVNGKEDTRRRGMEFAGRCWTLIRDSANLQTNFMVEAWKSVVSIFGIVEKERLFVTYSLRDNTDTLNNQRSGELALNEARDRVIEILENVDPSSKDYEQIVVSTKLLDVLVQIEYDLVGSVLWRVLSALINIPSPSVQLVTAQSSEFLTHVLEYHTKTRTVHAYASVLLDAVAASSSSTSWTCAYVSIDRSFPLAYHLPALSHALRTTLTPIQTTTLATSVLQAVEWSWEAFKGENQEQEAERAPKKRTVAGEARNNEREKRSVSAQARAFSYTSRVAATILSGLPSIAYTNDEEHSLEPLLCDIGNFGWTVIWDCLTDQIERERDMTKTRHKKKRKHSSEMDSLSTLCPQMVAAAALRFIYDIRARVSFLLGDRDRLGETQVRTLLNVASDVASDPELVLEVIRTLFWHMWYTHNFESKKQMEAQQIFTVTLDILTACPLSKSKWYGISTVLTRENLGIAILNMLTDRWIDVFDALSSAETLEIFISLLLSLSFDLTSEDGGENFDEMPQRQDHVVVTFRGIILKLFRNAQFWELHNIRAVLMSSLLTLTAPLSSDFSAESGSSSPIPAAAHKELASACNVYRLILYMPLEYFTRPARTKLVTRAMAGDIQICAVLEGANEKRNKMKRKDIGEKDYKEESKNWSYRLTFIRVFLQRAGHLLNVPGHTFPSTFVGHLLSRPSCISFPLKALTSVTLDLIQLHVMNLLRSQEQEASASISSIISMFTNATPFSRSSSPRIWIHVIVQSSVLNLVECLTGDFDTSSLPDIVICALKTLVRSLESALLPYAQGSVEADAAELDQLLSGGQINVWSRTLSLARWLGVDSEIASVPFGLKLAISTIRSKNFAILSPETCSSILGLLFEELWCMQNISHHVYLDVLVCFYAITCSDRSSDIERNLDARVLQASKKLSAEDFSCMLDIIAEAIGGSGLGMGQNEHLIHLGKVLLHNAPQGTLKVIRSFVTRCLNLFAVREEIYGGPSRLKIQYLEFIAKHCSDRPAAIRSVDLSSIWSLLDKTLSGSSEHDVTTAFPIFHHVVTIVGALIRLRRDIVVHTLPHLGLVLRRLMMLTRKIRPQLGARQTKMVTDTFPSWLSTSEPLSTDEARALARILTALTNKTVPRTHAYTTLTESRKAESLAKPFAKHASYVLVAYVDAFNDPLCIIDGEMRRELEPGLFALCEMVGEHSRDALMLSTLDSGGKTIMKSLWRDYEKQRYAGKG